MGPSALAIAAWLTLTASGIASLLLALPASAQVTIDLRALDALAPSGTARGQQSWSAPPPRGATARPGPAVVAPPGAAVPIIAAAPTTQGTSSGRSSMGVSPTSATSTGTILTGRMPPAPTPTAEPPNTVVAAAMPADATPTPAAPIPPQQQPARQPSASPDAVAQAATTGAGMRLTFDVAATELTPTNLAAVRQFAGSAPGGDAVTYNIVAYAAGKPDDPSVARRLSLSRALAVRTALIAEGVASSRIYVRALGGQSGGGPADRVDIGVLGANAAAPR